MNRTDRFFHGGVVMLILSRRNFESVVIGDPAAHAEHLFKVTVVGIDGGRVRLGFEVPADIPVNRWEVWHRIRANKQPESPPMSDLQ
jgi:carbon storage regulator